MSKGLVLPEFKDLLVKREVDLLNDRMAIALYEPILTRPNPTRFSELAHAVVSKPVVVTGRRFYRGVFFADEPQFEAFSEGSASMAALFFSDPSTPQQPLACLFREGVVARPNAGPVRLRFPEGWFVL